MGKPKPFKRPAVDLGIPDEPREWREIQLWEAEVGDIVADYGLVSSAARHPTTQTNIEKVILSFMSGRVETLFPGDVAPPVLAFVKK